MTAAVLSSLATLAEAALAGAVLAAAFETAFALLDLAELALALERGEAALVDAALEAEGVLAGASLDEVVWGEVLEAPDLLGALFFAFAGAALAADVLEALAGSAFLAAALPCFSLLLFPVAVFFSPAGFALSAVAAGEDVFREASAEALLVVLLGVAIISEGDGIEKLSDCDDRRNC